MAQGGERGTHLLIFKGHDAYIFGLENRACVWEDVITRIKLLSATLIVREGLI